MGFFTVDYLGRESRLWPVPLLYSVITNDTARVAMHIVLGTIAWGFLAHVLARSSRYPHVVTGIILVFGLTPQIVRFDLAILSESLGVSLLVIFIAASIQYLCAPSQFNLGIWFTSLICFSMTRSSQLIVLFAITAYALLRLIQNRSHRSMIFAITLSLLSAWGVLQLHNNRSMSELNFYTVLQERVIPDDDRFAWFVNEGMPVTEDVRQPMSYDMPSKLPGELLDYLQLPINQLPPSLMRLGGFPLAEWVRNEGWTTYARFLVTHPGDTWQRLFDMSSQALNPKDRDLLPLDNRTLIPRVAFFPWLWWVVAGTIASVIHLRFGQRYFSRFFFLSMATVGLWYATIILTSGIEHPRHAITLSVAIRLVSLVTIVGLLCGPMRSITNKGMAPNNDDESVIR
jgi:hypothetical protein